MATRKAAASGRTGEHVGKDILSGGSDGEGERYGAYAQTGRRRSGEMLCGLRRDVWIGIVLVINAIVMLLAFVASGVAVTAYEPGLGMAGVVVVVIFLLAAIVLAITSLL